MTLVFEPILTKGIAQISYLVGDTASGTAAVIDPRPDVEVYVELARKNGLAITHIVETHIQADYMSGSRELAERIGSAKIFLSREGEADYGFQHQPVHNGNAFPFGSVVLTARHTPGHTPEHLAYLLADNQHPETPWGVLTGDSLLVNSAARPDLLGEDMRERLVRELYQTLYGFYLGLGEEVIVYPGHSAGSACGAAIADRPMSTIGYERRYNPFLQFDDFETFRAFVLEGAPPIPSHYGRLKRLNRQGPPILAHLPSTPGLTPKAFKIAIEAGCLVLDVRSMHAFGGGHIPGAINIGAQPDLSVWAGEMLDPDRPILLVLEADEDLAYVQRLFLRTGFTNLAGYLVGGMTMWQNGAYPVEMLPQMSVQDLKAHAQQLQIVDVRSPQEWSDGHIPGATHAYLAHLREHLSELDPWKPTAVYCGSGYRASLAASLLQSHGFERVHSIPGSWQAWTNAGYPVEREERVSA